MPIREKIEYEVDPQNRLVLKKSGQRSNVAKFRKVLDGRFAIDEKNALSYHVDVPADSEDPKTIKLSGVWALDQNHNLNLVLDQSDQQIDGKKLTISGEWVDVSDNQLLFAVTTKESANRLRTYLLNFSGRWHADEHNQLSFKIEQEQGSSSQLTFIGSWELDRKNSITYTFQNSKSEREQKAVNALTFKGHWDITRKDRISYVLNEVQTCGVKANASLQAELTSQSSCGVNQTLGSQFDFNVGWGRMTAEGLRYEVSIGAIPAKKSLVLLGKWQVNKNGDLSLELVCEDGKPKSIEFGCSYDFDRDTGLSFKLSNRLGEDLGLELKLTKRLAKDKGEIFLKGDLSKKEMAVSLGAGILW